MNCACTPPPPSSRNGSHDLSRRAAATTALIALALVALWTFISFPVFSGRVGGHDFWFHLQRIASIAQGLDTSFPVYLYPGFSWHYGYPTGIFYGDAFLYPFALLVHFEWLNPPQAFRLFVFFRNAAVILIAFYSFHRIFTSKKMALFGCLLYCASVWHLTNLYVRCAVGEYTAMVFLPLLAAGISDLYHQRTQSGILLLIAGFTGLLHSHVITTILAADCLALYLLIEWRAFIRGQNMWRLAVMASVVLALNAGFIVPFVDFYVKTPISDVGRLMRGHSLWELVPQRGPAHGGLYYRAIGSAQVAIFVIGIGCMVFALLERNHQKAYQAWATREHSCPKEYTPLRPLVVTLLLSAVFLWLWSDYFPYTFVATHAPPLYAVLCSKVMFSMRYNTVTTLLLALAAMQVAAWLTETEHRRRAGKWFLALIALLTLVQGVHILARTMQNRVRTDEEINLRLPVQADPIYLLRGTNRRAPMTRNLLILPSHPTEVSITDTVRTNFTFTLHARNTSKEPGWLDFPVWNYPGYKAITSKGYKLGVADGENRRVRVYLPPRFNDTFTLRWVVPWYWRVAHWVSWVSMAALLLFAFTPLPRWLARQRLRVPILPAHSSAPW